MLFAEPITMSLVAVAALLLCMAIIGGIIALLVNRRTRLPTAILLVAGILSLALVIGFAVWARFNSIQNVARLQREMRQQLIPVRVEARSDSQAGVAIPANPPNAMAAKAKPIVEKTEQQQAQEAAQRAAVVVRATLSALGRAMIDPERTLAESKATKQGRTHPSPLPTNLRSVPGEGTIAMPTRPEWIDAPPHVVSLGGPLSDVYQMSVNVGPYTSRAECDEKLPEELQKAVGRYGQLCLGEAAGPVRLPQDVLRQVVKAQWEETRPYSVGPMTHLHVLLQFDHQVKERLLDEHRRVVVAGRLEKLGGCVAAGLMLMTVALGYLKIDLATGGAYRRRLRLAAAVGILAVVAVAIAVLG